jgi:hypothetical protein
MGQGPAVRLRRAQIEQIGHAMSARATAALRHRARHDAEDPAGADFMTSMVPEAMAWRAEQAEIDADIEGLADDPGSAELLRRMEAENVPPDEQRRRLRAYFEEHEHRLTAAG